MRSVVLRKMGYEGTFIYVYQFGFIFQYLFTWGNEIYQDNITITPNFWRRIASYFGFLNPYSDFMLDQGEAIVLSGAMKSIDALKNMPKQKKVKIKKAAKDGACMWQTFTADKTGIPVYKCIIHNKIVPMVENEAPSHLLSYTVTPINMRYQKING